MADILSDEDVFGPSASGKAPTGNPFAQPITRVASEEGVMSDADVFGSGGKIKVAKVKTTAPTLREGAEAGLSAGAELGKQYLTAPGATAKRVAKESLSAIDLVTTGPMQMIGDVFGQTVGRVVAAASGATREEANDFGKEYGASIASHPLLNQPLTKLYNWLSNSDEATTVDAAMGKVSETITEIGKKVEKSTGKALRTEDVELLTEALMAGAGGRMQQRALEARKAKAGPPATPTAAAAVKDAQADALYARHRGATDLRARDAVDENTGVYATQDAVGKKAKDARRAQARAAFSEDPAYADYLRNYAEEEARLRNLEHPLGAPGGEPTAGPRAPRTGLREALIEEELPPGSPPPVETGSPSALDSGLAKIRQGRSFNLTAEEKIALRDTTSTYGRPELVNEAGAPLRQKGSMTPDMQRLIAGLGLGVGLAAYAYNNEDSDLGYGLLGLGTIAGARSALGPALKESGYTLKTLERLPQGKTEFTAAQVKEQLARPDVSKAEKDLVLGVLGNKETITSKDLVAGFNEANRNLRLQPEETQDYADYGLENVGREAAPKTTQFDIASAQKQLKFEQEALEYAKAHGEDTHIPEREIRFWSAQVKKLESLTPARTTVYQSPIALGESNHFGDPNYFAHTRSFDEGGVRHVVEVQSDVAQHAKTLTPEKTAELNKSKEIFERHFAVAEEVHDAFNTQGVSVVDQIKALNKLERAYDPDVLLDHKLVMGDRMYRRYDGVFNKEVEALFDAGNSDGIYDFLKGKLRAGLPADEHVKVVNAFEDALYKEWVSNRTRLQEIDVALRGAIPSEVEPILKNWFKRIIREELAQAQGGTSIPEGLRRDLKDLDPERLAKMEQGKPVRFATADTVAKVEMWPKRLTVDFGREADVPGLDKYKHVGNVKDVSGQKHFGEFIFTGRVRGNSMNLVDVEMRNTKTGETFWRAESNPSKEVVQALGGKEIFEPEHQSIYDRYKGEIEKFLRNDLKAQPYTDPNGHTWLEVPPRPRGPTQMFGRSDVGSLAALAAFTGGAVAIHAWSEDPSLVRDVAAGLFASALTRIRPKGIVELYQSAKNARPLESIAAAAITRESHMRLAAVDVANTTKRTTELVPTEAGQQRINTALDTGVTKGLTKEELQAYQILKDEYAKLAKAGLDSGILKSALREYSTHIWKRADPSFLDKLFQDRGTGTSQKTPYSLARAYKTLAEGKAAGLVPVSENASFIFAAYSHSLIAAIENTRLLETIKAQKTAGGDLYIQPTGKAPPSYVRLNSPQLQGLAIHPEIEPQMKFIFDNPSSAGIPAALEIIADVSKRSAVAMSLFHVKALTDSMIGSLPADVKTLGKAALGAAVGVGVSAALGDEHPGRDAALGGMIGYSGSRLKAYAFGTSDFLKEVKQGSASPLIDRAVKSGLTFGVEKGPLVVDDAGRRFYDAMKLVQQEADRVGAPVGIKAGVPVELYVRANHFVDAVMWGRMHTGMKLETWSKTSDILRESSIARNAHDPKSRILSQAEADAIAANFANDQFGGLNWTRLAMESKTQIGRRIAQEVYSPHGRQVMRIAMFAPDWTISTARAVLTAVDGDLVNPLKWGSVARGFFEPITRGDLARQYVARSALYYLTIGDAINYSMSGHHLWENDDKIGWSYIDWGDGRKMQFSKHIMETVHWFDTPVKQGVGKLGYVPKEVANQALGTEYLAPKPGKTGDVFAGPRMKDPSPGGRLEHAAKGFIPIPLQGSEADAAAWSFLGMPLYGKTAEQKAEAKRLRLEAKRKARK